MIVAAVRRGALAALTMLPLAAATHNSTDALCRSISQRLNSVPYKDCHSSGFVPASGSTSVRGLPLVYRDLPASAVAANQRPPRIMLIGGIHGDELASVSIIFRWMPMLVERRNIHWRIIPLANPDGMLSMPSRRTNANGVDLNRNFNSSDWPAKAVRHWEDKTLRDPRRNPGPRPASEPETRWLQEQIAEFQPDAIISIHAPYGVLDFDGPSDLHPKRFGHLRLSRLGVYPGSLGNYAWADRGMPVVTLEFTSARSMPTRRELRLIWGDMLRWVQQNVQARGSSNVTGVQHAAIRSSAQTPSPWNSMPLIDGSHSQCANDTPQWWMMSKAIAMKMTAMSTSANWICRPTCAGPALSISAGTPTNRW